MIHVLRLAFAVIFIFTFDFSLYGQYSDCIYQSDREYNHRTINNQLQRTPRDTINRQRIITNSFKHNWYLEGGAGLHTYQDRNSRLGLQKGTISPEFSIGVGKWFTPSIAVQLDVIKSSLHGYTQHLSDHYGTGSVLESNDGIKYREMHAPWIGGYADIKLNLSRLFKGYEGYRSNKMMNQFMTSLGFGILHHTGLESGSDNYFNIKFEAQYSRFFNSDKRFSFDFRLRCIIYELGDRDDFGYRVGPNLHCRASLGVGIGLTYYFGKDRSQGWSSPSTQAYQKDFRKSDITSYSQHSVKDISAVESNQSLKTVTFYVFFPEYYSGRNDRPIQNSSDVNAIDYLIGGIYTQKRFVDTPLVKTMLKHDKSLMRLSIEDIPTYRATRDLASNVAPRGYEMNLGYNKNMTMSHEEMDRFEQNHGYYYAPMWDGQNEWHYRIDNEALGDIFEYQNELSEKECFGLNSSLGLSLIAKSFDISETDYLVSFADMYAALYGNVGYVSKFTDANTVKKLSELLSKSYITLVETHALANLPSYTFRQEIQPYAVFKSIGDYRMQTVAQWLLNERYFTSCRHLHYQDNQILNDTSSSIYLQNPNLQRKLSNCVKVSIQLIY